MYTFLSFVLKSSKELYLSLKIFPFTPFFPITQKKSRLEQFIHLFHNVDVLNATMQHLTKVFEFFVTTQFSLLVSNTITV